MRDKIEVPKECEQIVKDILDELWLRIHVQRFDGDSTYTTRHGKARKPDTFYSGVLRSKNTLLELKQELGLGNNA